MAYGSDVPQREVGSRKGAAVTLKANGQPRLIDQRSGDRCAGVVVVADPQLGKASRQPAYRKLTGYESGSSLGRSRRHARWTHAANRRTHDFLEPKTGSVASTEDASPPRRYPR